MKKLMALLLVMILMLSTVCVASADTTTLTFTVPEAKYTLLIPQNAEIPYGTETQFLGTVGVRNESGFKEGMNLRVTVSASPFTCATTDTVMAYTLSGDQGIPNGKEMNLGTNFSLLFFGKDNGNLHGPFVEGTDFMFDVLFINFKAEDWDTLKPGDYAAAITFNAEIVYDTTD